MRVSPFRSTDRSVEAQKQQLDLSYYTPSGSFKEYTQYSVTPAQDYSVRRYLIESDYGQIVLDYFDIREDSSDAVIVVFPILGGKNKISNYFADALTKLGFECVIIHRSDTFKDPKVFARIEQTLRENVLRDRVAMDFMQEKLGKNRFAGFGMSRGGMNLVLTAGVDKRLKYNVIALAGHDLGKVLQDSEEWRIRSHFEKLSVLREESEQETFQYLHKSLRTQPYKFAVHIEPQETLLILAALDSTVPFRYGLELRELLGNPETLFLLSGHATSLIYSQFFRIPFPGSRMPLFPLPYIEYELGRFYSDKLKERRFWKHLPFGLIQAPINFIGSLLLA